MPPIVSLGKAGLLLLSPSSVETPALGPPPPAPRLRVNPPVEDMLSVFEKVRLGEREEGTRRCRGVVNDRGQLLSEEPR